MLEKEDKVISDLLTSLGPWSKHVVIGGGYALFIYKLYLSNSKTGTLPVGTRDIDTLIPRKLPIASQKSIAKHLSESGFKQVFKSIDTPPTEAYVKEIDGMEVEVEFLTDSSTRNDKNQNVSVSGIIAQPLSYLELSLKTIIPFETYSKEQGKVVSPAAWIFHKGLTFTKRKKSSKRLKDLYGIWYVTSQLDNLSGEILNEFKKLTTHHSSWFDTFQKNLKDWMSKASPSEWNQLEAQEPTGR